MTNDVDVGDPHRENKVDPNPTCHTMWELADPQQHPHLYTYCTGTTLPVPCAVVSVRKFVLVCVFVYGYIHGSTDIWIEDG